MNTHIATFRKISIRILTLILICSLPAFAVIRYVDLNSPAPTPPYTSWATAATVIQDAVDACSSGDEVIVTNGVYETGGALTPGYSLSNRVCIAIPITVRSVNGPEVTTILGQGPTGTFATRCVYISERAYLSGFMLRNGGTFISGNTYLEQSGGGLLFHSGGIVSNCFIGGGSAQKYGGGAYCYLGGTLYDCFIFRNIANTGAGGVHTYRGDALVQDCIISENYSFASGGGVVLGSGARVIASTIADNYSTGAGGGAQCFGGSFLLNSTINGNSNGYHGAGIACYSGSIISNCTISENTSPYDGGGIYCNQGGSILACTIISNWAYSSGGGIACNRGGIISNCVVKSNSSLYFGGGIYCYESDIVTACIIMDNYGGRYGGGVSIHTSGEINNCLIVLNRSGYGGGVYTRDGGSINSCTISGNSAIHNGGGVELYNAGYITNSIVYYNTATTHSNYYHFGTNMGYAYCCITPDPGGEGNITTSPQFASIPATNYHLQITSPCINAGTNLPWMTGAVDLDGHARITQGRVDIGAYEWFCGTQTPFVDITTTPQIVSMTLEEIRVAGTTDCHVVGTMLASNTANNVSVSFAAARGWQTPLISLFKGDNVIVVSGTNFYGDVSSDTVTISRSVLTNYVSLDGRHIYPFTNWNMSATNIQAAVDAIPVGGLTIVSNGVYNMGSTVTPGHSLACRVVVDKAITLESLNGPAVTIIAGQGPPGNSAVRCVYITNLVFFSGFTLSNGYTRVTGDLTYDCSGGGVLLDNGGTVSNCIAVANYALDRGGGMFCYNGGTVIGSDLNGNWGNSGAGICIEADGLLSHSSVNGNSASGDGGGVYCITNGTIINCLIHGNEARGDGGGAAWNVSCMIESSTIAANSAQGSGGGVHGGGWGSILNSIIMLNTASTGSNIDGFASCTYTCSAPEPTGPGNISDDPEFIDVGTHDFRLQFGSACLNTGANQSWMTGAKDLAGNPRICCGKVDMGAYEMLYGCGAPAVSITSTTTFIAYHLPTGPIAGTNNTNITGPVWWSNVYQKLTGPVTPDPVDPTAWTADVPLVHGDNLVGVYGSNCFGRIGQDEIKIHRETYQEGIPKINADTLIFPYGGSMLSVDHPTNIIWNPAGITDLIDGTNLTINCISIHRSNDLAETAIPATNMPNISGWCPWQPPQELISGPTTYVVRFEVVDSSSLSNSWVFYDHAFIVVPEPVIIWLVLLVLVMLRKLNRL